MQSEQSTIEGREILFARQLNAPRELVFEVWTDPNHLAKWWGPDGFTTTTNRMDVKVGGIWQFIMHGPDGGDYKNKIIYLEVIKPERLVYKHAGDEETEPVNFHVTVTFEKIDERRTLLTMKSVFDSEEDLQRVVREYGAFEGAKQHLARLSSYLVEIKPNPE